MKTGKRVSSWERGCRASAHRSQARETLWDVVAGYARLREERAGGRRDLRLRDDARELLGISEVDRFIAGRVQGEDEIEEADVAAAVVSVYAETVWERCGRLHWAYEEDLADMLTSLIAPTLGAMRLRLSDDERVAEVLHPMARFFLTSLRRLRCDRNALRPAGTRRLRVRPFGWAPGDDALTGALSLLILGQPRNGRWSGAMMSSALAHHLQTGQWVQRVQFKKAKCPACLTEDGRATAMDRRCGNCGGPVKVKTVTRLLATRHIERRMRLARRNPEARWRTPLPGSRNALTQPAEDGPETAAVAIEELERGWRIALARVRELWREVVLAGRGSACRIATLLALTGQTNVTASSLSRMPGSESLRRLILKLLENGAVAACEVRRILPAVARAVGEDAASLTPGHLRVILHRLRKRVLGQ